MGDHRVSGKADRKVRAAFIRHLLRDVEALEYMLDHDLFEKGITRIGAEQEFCLVDEHWRPANNSMSILEHLNDSHFTTELARYNLEINLDPIELKGHAFSDMATQLTTLLDKAKQVAASHDSKVLLTGILPTISKDEINLDYMTPNPRYYALNEMMRKLRGSDFRMVLTGVDELSLEHDSVMFEACNTSFQLHLQIHPSDFIRSYNWAQAIAGPVLGISVNSPLLLGKELWHETRIALFQQSIDTRKVSYAINNQEGRVSFGNEWMLGEVADIFKSEITRYKIILTKKIQEDSLDMVTNGNIPKLQALNLHNGTIYRWNRACYGVGNGHPHLRIENRYIPAGPTITDQMANFAFWVGLMKGRPARYDNIHEVMDFKAAKFNFIKAARSGADILMHWMGKKITLYDLILNELLPIAREGLNKVGIVPEHIDYYLGVIAERAQKHTAARWMINSYRQLNKQLKVDDALVALTSSIYEKQQHGVPVAQWPVLDRPPSDFQCAARQVGHIMTTTLVTTSPEDNAAMTLHLMKWRNIHHLPVVGEHDELLGLVTWRHLNKFLDNLDNDSVRVEDIMTTNIITAIPNTPIEEVIATMKNYEIGCMPILHDRQLIGIVTIKDLLKFDNG